MKLKPTGQRGFTVLLACAGMMAFLADSQAQTIKWGLQLANINNPITPIVATNAPGNGNGPLGVDATTGSITITAGGGDTYGAPDSFTYAYQQLTGDFDIRVRIQNVTATDPFGQDSPKGSLMVRASLDAASPDFQISALPADPSSRHGQIESIGRVALGNDTDDLPGRGQKYGGDTTVDGYCTYPDVWLRIQRQGSKLMSYFATASTTDYPSGSSPLSTNGWQLLVIMPIGTNFGSTVYVGLSTVAHNNDLADTTHTVSSTYSDYGPTPALASLPSANGVLVDPTNAPGVFPDKQVAAVNFNVRLPADGLGYPGNTRQSDQGSPSPIVWNNGGFGSVSRDEIVDFVTQETAVGFSVPRYQLGAFDFELSPRDPVAANQNLGPYSNPNRERYGSGGLDVAGSQAWAPTPTHGFAMSTVHKNGAAWNDGSPAFHGATYMQLDNGTSSLAYDMIGGHFRSGFFYTRHTKLVTGDSPSSPTLPGGPASGNLQRAALPISIAYFPYEMGWKAGYFDNPAADGTPQWKFGNGYGTQSGAALSGITYPYDSNGHIQQGQSMYNSPQFLLTWLDPYQDATFAGLAQFRLPGVNSLTDGILFTVGNDENNSIRGPFANNAPLPDGSGWYVAVRDIETSKNDPTIYATSGSDAGRSFSFLFVPYNSENLIGGHIATNGATIKGAGNFTVQHLSKGRYAVTIPGKSDATGMLLIQNTGYLAQQPAGYTNVVDTSLLSYEFGGTNTPANAFIIESRFLQPDLTGTVDGVEALRDGEFNFVYVDFQHPLAPPGYTPVVSAVRSANGGITLTWTGTLQAADSVTGPYTNVAATSPLTVTATAAAKKFYRAVR